MMRNFDPSRESAIDDIALGLRDMAASALGSKIEPFHLRRVLRFIENVIQVIDQSFANIYGILVDLRHLSLDDLKRRHDRELAKELDLTLARSHFRDSLEICSRLRHLRSHYDAFILPILQEKGLDQTEWSSVFSLIDEYEGAIVRLIEKTVCDVSQMLQRIEPDSLSRLHHLASERAELLRDALRHLRDLEGRIMGISGEAGLLELSADNEATPSQVLFHTYFDRSFTDNRKVTHMGDNFSNIGSGTTITSRSLVQSSMNKVRSEAGTDVAEALKKIAETVIASGNKEAVAFLDQFNEELQKHEPRKTLLRASWDNLVKTLPAVTSIAGAAGAIAKLFV